MPRRSQEDMCLICESTPCACRAKPKKQLPVRQAPIKATPVQPTPAPPPAQKRAGLSAVRKPEPKPAQVRQPLLPPPVARVDPEEAALRRAVTLFVSMGMVEPRSVAEHRRLIDLSDTEIRAIQWRQRREASAKRTAGAGAND